MSHSQAFQLLSERWSKVSRIARKVFSLNVGLQRDAIEEGDSSTTERNDSFLTALSVIGSRSSLLLLDQFGAVSTVVSVLTRVMRHARSIHRIVIDRRVAVLRVIGVNHGVNGLGVQ